MNQFLHSAIYEGTVTHHRRHPVEHLFSTRLFHLYVDLAEVDSVGQGRVWTGLDAWERGLVDSLGGLETAFAIARESAGVQPR